MVVQSQVEIINPLKIVHFILDYSSRRRSHIDRDRTISKAGMARVRDDAAHVRNDLAHVENDSGAVNARAMPAVNGPTYHCCRARNYGTMPCDITSHNW